MHIAVKNFEPHRTRMQNRQMMFKKSYRADRFWVDSRFGQMYVSPTKQENPPLEKGMKHEKGEVFWYMDWTGNYDPSQSYQFYKIISAHEIAGWACINTYAMVS